MSSTSRTGRGWFSTGLSRGALGGLLTAVSLGGVEVVLVAARADALSAVQLIVLGVYAVGLSGLVLLPFGSFVGLGIAAWRHQRSSTLTGWLNELACDHERDLQASRTLIGVVSGVGVMSVLTGVVHYSLVHDLNNPLMAAVFDGLLTFGALAIALLSAGISMRMLSPIIEKIPFESFGRPHMTKFQGVLYTLLALSSGGALFVGVIFYNPDVWSPAYLLQLAMVLLGPALLYQLLQKVDPRGRWSGHPLVFVFAVIAIGLLSFRPIISFGEQPEIREASMQHTEIERRLLLGLMSSVGDRDGDGYAGLFGGPDCDDADDSINPGAFDEPGNGIDENCFNGDAEAGRMRKRSSSRAARRAALLAKNTAGGTKPGAPKAEASPNKGEKPAPSTATPSKDPLVAPKGTTEPKTPSTPAVNAVDTTPATNATPAVGATKDPFAELKTEGMNIIILLIDTVRVDHLSYSGYERPTTPMIDALAARSINFTHAYSHAPNTPRSVPSLLMSRYPSEIKWRKRSRNFSPVNESNLSVFETLEEKGYRNHMLSSHWYFQKKRKLHQGFHAKGYDNAGWVDLAPSNTDISSPRIMGRLDSHLDRLVENGTPWSLMIHLPDPHGRYMNHKGKTPAWGSGEKGVPLLMGKYDRELRFVDGHVGKMIENLEARGLMKNTIIVLTSDHGEAFKEHGHLFHGQTLYEEILRVPLLLYIPGIKGQTIDTPVELIDVAPTLLDLLSFEIPESFRGRSLLPAIFTPKEFEPQPVYAEHLACKSWDKEMRALIDGDHKIIWRVTEGFFELYNLADDPGENINLMRKNPEVAAMMKARIVEFTERELDIKKKK